MQKLSLVEEFYSIQGEGLLSGVPSIFLRFGGCNLRCEGFKTKYKIDEIEQIGCDSYYAVDPNFSQNWTDIDNIEDVKKIISKYPKTVKDIVLTGGEPLIYSKNELFLEILRYFKKLNFRITIETNGTLFLEDKDEFKDIIYSLSLKLANSEEEFNKRFNIDSIHSIINKSEKSFFKFTLDKYSIKRGATFEILKMVRFFPELPVYCMPIGSNIEELEKNAEAVIKLCLEQGFIYSDRLQIRIWNNKKGC